MVTTGSGEEVSPDWIRSVQRLTDARLVQMRGQGLSDQRVAAINSILASRSAGQSINEKALVKQLGGEIGQASVGSRSRSKPKLFFSSAQSPMSYANIPQSNAFQSTAGRDFRPSARPVGFDAYTNQPKSFAPRLPTSTQVRQTLAQNQRRPLNLSPLRGTARVLDVLSGGRITNKIIDRGQLSLNREVDKFNKRIEGRQLSEAEYNRALRQLSEFERLQEQLDEARGKPQKELDKLVKDTSSRTGKVTLSSVLDILDVGKVNPFESKKNQAQALGAGIAIANALITLGESPSTLNALRQNPKAFVTSVKDLPKTAKGGIVKRAKLFVVNPDLAVAQVTTEIGTQYVTFKGTDKGLKVTGALTKKGVTKLSPYFKKLETTPLGVRVISKIKGVGKIEIIEPRGTRFRQVNPTKAVKEANLPAQLKPNPTLPKVNEVQKGILDVVKKQGDVVSGSYAQNVFLKRKFSRKFKDLDILTLNRAATIKALRQKFGRKVSFKKKLRSIEVKYKGKVVADLVEFAEGERLKGGKSFVQKYGFARVNGLNVVRPQVRLASKVAQFGIGKKGKVLKDIELLTGKKGSLKRPSVLGAYTGKQAKVGTRATLTSSQSNLFQANKIQRIRNAILRKKPSLKLKKWFYATPEIDGVAQARVTRLGLPGKEEASLIDLLSRKATLTKGKPTIFVLPKEKIFKAPKGLSKNKIVKTPGFVVPKFSKELEVVLGKGFLLQKGKRLGTTLIDGNRVAIVQLKKIKIPKNIKSELKSLNKLESKLGKKKLSIKNRNKLIKQLEKKGKLLEKKIQKATKIDYKSVRPRGKKFFPLRRKLVSGSLRVPKRRSGRITSRVTSVGLSPRRSGTTSPTPSTIPRTPSRPPSRPPVGTPSRPPSSPPRRPPVRRGGATPIKPLPRIRSFKKQKTVSKPVQTYNVFVKVGRKFVRVNKGKLTKQDALNKGAYVVDNTVAKTFKVEKSKKSKTLNRLPNEERNYFTRTGKKYRPFRIKKGSKFSLKPISKIERRRFGIDTRGEKRGLSVSRYLKARGVSTSTAKKAQLSKNSKAYKQKLKALRKARRVLARKRS